MNYDFYESPLVLKYSVHHNPLYSTNSKISVDSSVNYWLKNGFPREKLLVGVESFARTYTLHENRINDLGSSILNYGDTGSFTSLPGVISYFEVKSSQVISLVKSFFFMNRYVIICIIKIGSEAGF